MRFASRKERNRFDDGAFVEYNKDVAKKGEERMNNDKERRIMEKMIARCERIEAILKEYGRDFNVFLTDVAFQDACCMNVIRIGDLVGQLSAELKARRSLGPWAQIRAASDYLTRDYDAAEPELIWETLRQDVPTLRGVLLEILAENELDAG